MPHILVVENDLQVRAALLRVLTERKYTCSSAATGTAGLAAVVDDRPDLVVVDLDLPDFPEVLRMLRAVSAVPVIVATARADGHAIVRALDAGVDDYLVPPFDAGQVDTRVRRVLRRSAADLPRQAMISVGGLRVSPDARAAWLDGRLIELTRREFDLLCYLAQRAGIVVTKRELLAQVWRKPDGGANKTIDVHLSWLRRKLGETGQTPRYLHTVRGVGVRLVDKRTDAAAQDPRHR